MNQTGPVQPPIPGSTPHLHTPEVLLFQPDPFQQGVLDSFDRIPRYLFRLYAPNTAGSTSISSVTSPAWNCDKAEKKRDLSRLGPSEAAELLNKHLNWNIPHESECNLMSWSSSLLFVIQYGLYRHGHRRRFDHPALSKIFLLVVDTRDFPRGAFIRDLEAIETFKDHSQELASLHRLRTGTEYYFGEYLSQGHLNIEGRCSRTSIQRMINLGLFNLCPEIGEREHWHEWAKPVVRLRSGFQDPESAARTESSDVRKAITIAQGCFGDRWALPVAAMLLSLKPRRQGDDVILGGFQAMFTSKTVTPYLPGREVLANFILETEMETLSPIYIKTESNGLPEVSQYENIIRELSLRLIPTVTRVETQSQPQPRARQQSINPSVDELQKSMYRLSVQPETPTPQLSVDGEWMLAFVKGQNLLIKAPPSSHEDNLPLTVFRLGVSSKVVAQFKHEAGSITWSPGRFYYLRTTLCVAARTGHFLITWRVNRVFEGHENPSTIGRYADNHAASDALASLGQVVAGRKTSEGASASH